MTSSVSFLVPLCIPTRTAAPQLTSRRPRRNPYLPSQLPISTRLRLIPRSAATPDYYSTLDVPEDAEPMAIKRAYRRAALKNHPDVSKAPDARERFLRVQEAYAVLSDPSRRADYDRRRRFASGFSDSSSGFSSSPFNTEEFSRRWRETNPMPDDLNDNLGSIFSDLFSGVSDAVNSPGARSAASGVVEDFIDFLEKRVEPFTNSTTTSSTSSSSTSTSSSRSSDPTVDADDEQLLRTAGKDVLSAEAEDARFILTHLRERARKARADEDDLRTRARQWGDRADRADAKRDYPTRDAARDQETQLIDEARRFARRADDAVVHIRLQERRLQRFEKRLDELQRAQTKRTETSSSNRTRSDIADDLGTPNNVQRASARTPRSQEAAIDDELDAMKRELGL